MNPQKINLANLSQTELLELAKTLTQIDEKQKFSKFESYYSDTGPNRKELYPKHWKCFDAGSKHLVRAFIGGNGTGKSVWGSYELTCHLTGLYPPSWKGKVYNKPIMAWAASVETKQLRAGIQEILFGKYSDPGTGMIPKKELLDDSGKLTTTAMNGTANCIGTARVRHYTKGKFDGWSEIEFKTYEQGWANFQGATRDFIWLDEEPSDPKVYAECLARTRGPAGKEGSVICTFTPLLGYSTVYLSFLPNGKVPENGINTDTNTYTELVSWDDVPHLSESWKTNQIATWKLTDPNSIEARTKGIAAMGSGRIYPINEDLVIVPPLKIPSYWKKAYGLDPGWNNTACVWIAEDPDTNIKYIYSEYKNGKVVDVIHVEAIKNRGPWIPGSVDPHGAKHKRDDGTDKIDYFNSLGLDLIPGTGDPTTLRSMILGMFESGSLKIVENCINLLNEVRIFRYDLNDPNKPAKGQDDHLCDAMMYGIAKFDQIAISYSEIEDEEGYSSNQPHYNNDDRSDITGY